jgi:hypothetical protein
MARWKRLIVSLSSAAPTGQPWYRRPDTWLLAGAVVLPFGWVLPLARAAWVSVSARRAHASAGLSDGGVSGGGDGPPTARTQ